MAVVPTSNICADLVLRRSVVCPTQFFYNRGSDGGRATLLLLDRADDPLSPLMHEFTYQCLVEDLLDIEVIILCAP